MHISQLDFCIQDVALFLDTHPNDKEALNYFNEARENRKKRYKG